MPKGNACFYYRNAINERPNLPEDSPLPMYDCKAGIDNIEMTGGIEVMAAEFDRA